MRSPVEIIVVCAVTALGLVPNSALAQDSADGRRLAQQWCASCHIVAPGADGSDAARPFGAIANDPYTTEAGLRAWLAAPHPPMPDLDLTRAEVAAIVDYIKSLRRD